MNSNLLVRPVLILAAAGSSSRMGISQKKEYLPLNRGSVLSECVRIFLDTISLSSIVVTIPKNGELDARTALFRDSQIKILLERKDTNIYFVEGGDTRQKSVFNALQFLEKFENKPEIVMIHDGARPFVTSEIICETLEASLEFGAAVPGVQPVDTQKLIDNSGFITEHLKRAQMVAVQTPQSFKFSSLLEAHKKAAMEGVEYTDDTEIWGKYIGKVKSVCGDIANKKITYSEDYCVRKNTAEDNNMDFRTGLGYDIHPLVEGRKLLIGGIEFEFEKGEQGHSDGDALLHAITDALLGASGLGDIGGFFPPEDNKWKDANSSVLLKTAWEKITAEGWHLNNLDCVVKLQKPKFLPKRQEVIDSIATTLNVERSRIFVKAKTGEHLDSVGRGESIEAWCTCILVKNV